MHYSFTTYYQSVFTRPARAFESLVTDWQQLRFGTAALAIMALLYTLVYAFLILCDGRPFTPWLNIPPDAYYRYNVFFCAPTMFLGCVLASGVVHLCCRIFTAAGTFEGIFSVFAFGIGIASWATALHDLATSFLGAIHIINQQAYELMLNTATIWRTLLWIQMLIYLIWFIILFTKGVQKVYMLRPLPALLLGTLGFAVYQTFFFVFNR